MPKTPRPIELPVFAPSRQLPRSMADVRRTLRLPLVRSVHSYALGPEGTNIIQAARLWHAEMGVSEKADLIPCETPEQAVVSARGVTERGVLAIYWTCAVFVRENQVFFENPDTLPFAFQQTMKLDEMQLATRPELADPNAFSAEWRILTHPSPAPLISGLACSVINVNSNADAARRCAAGEAEACITTETARRIYGLAKIHSFGSPDMTFFGGICQAGAALLRRAFEESVSFDAKPDRQAQRTDLAA